MLNLFLKSKGLSAAIDYDYSHTKQFRRKDNKNLIPKYDYFRLEFIFSKDINGNYIYKITGLSKPFSQLTDDLKRSGKMIELHGSAFQFHFGYLSVTFNYLSVTLNLPLVNVTFYLPFSHLNLPFSHFLYTFQSHLSYLPVTLNLP